MSTGTCGDYASSTPTIRAMQQTELQFTASTDNCDIKFHRYGAQ